MRERKHAGEMPREVEAVLLVGVDDCLGVGAAAEHMALGLQPRAQLQMVVDLPVEGDPDGAVLVAERLSAGLAEVDDAEPAMTERDAFGHVAAVVIRTTVYQPCLHPLDEKLVAPVEPADTTHDDPSSPSVWMPRPTCNMQAQVPVPTVELPVTRQRRGGNAFC